MTDDRRGLAVPAAGVRKEPAGSFGELPEDPFPALRRPAWESRYAFALVVVDAAAITAAALLALLVRFGPETAAVRGVPYTVVSVLLAPVWIGVLAASRAYESRYMGVGSDEFKRVFDASIRLLACVATVAYAFRVEIARGFVGVALPVGTLFLLAGRYAARHVLHRLRAQSIATHRVVVVGDRVAAAALVTEVRRAPYAGFDVVGACVPGDGPLVAGDARIPVLGSPAEAPACLREVGADTVAVAGGWTLGPDGVRRLAWQLEGTGVDLVVAPALTDVTGPRIHIRPVAGLPLLHVEEPELSGVRRVVKGAFDRAVGLLLLAVAAPVIAAGALAVALTSPGGPFFSQARVGIDGRSFRLWKLRTMYADAEARRAELAALNEREGALFKVRRDPRVTRVGRLLRRWSLDELPQLVNVVRGDMSLVGPRPPLPSEVEEYATDARRRLLVKPGLTGLWQVSGRSDLSWDETVRLDLHYVENWSITTDFAILWRTLGAVLRGRGAY